jgi:hypothetical protein
MRARRFLDVTPPRSVRKTIFRLRFWRPDRQRRHAQREQSRDIRLSTKHNVSDQLIVGCVNVQSIARKSAMVCRTIDEANTDLMVLPETWHEYSGAVSLQSAIPEVNKCFDAARPLPPGANVNTLSLRSYGGSAVIYRCEAELRKRALDLSTTTFENFCCVANFSG